MREWFFVLGVVVSVHAFICTLRASHFFYLHQLQLQFFTEVVRMLQFLLKYFLFLLDDFQGSTLLDTQASALLALLAFRL